ncbi:Cilia- and flagella-associated protein 47 [Merluccius polli]|uniref:Cilia- and flagella-associated protein 47 n=1 Tax=Merluccius polli TaxID=89951 RepID=A0AA47MY82_MERPO|nr:Cilia- and flagella-associated protein 47 [Merluccius polli]
MSSSVRVEPPSVRFSDVEVGEVYQATVTVTNVGKTSTKIVLLRPPSKPFKFTFNSPASTAVAPGLSVSGSLTFSPERAEEVKDRLGFLVDGLTTVEIPLLVCPPACKLLLDSLVDFGSVAATSQVVSKQLPLTNQGSAPGQYQVQYNGDPSIKLSDGCGTVMPGATQWLTLELSTHTPRLIEETALVKLQNSPDRILRIRAEVVNQTLQIYDLQGAPLPCVSFGPVYFGTSRVERVVLKNNGPRTCHWLGLLQDTAEGTELATELRKSTDAALLGRRMETPSSAPHDPTQVVCCVPKQGQLGPYEDMTLSIHFSPFCKRTVEDRKRDRSAAPQDYALFLLFEPVDNKHGFTPLNAPTAGHGVELAVTGAGLPVRLLPEPGASFRFLGCARGQRSDLLCLLRNLCSQLPVHFRFRKVAQFRAEPASGLVAPGQCQDVVLSFAPRQLGSFRGVRLKVDVLGHVTDPWADAAAELRLRPFHTLTLDLSAVCHAQTTRPEPILNPGITPPVTNPSGQRPHVPSAELASCAGTVCAAVLGAATTRLHAHRRGRSQSLGKEELVAFPNDRAASIRPSSPRTEYRTIFTGIRRYRYVDPDYAFTEEEEEDRKRRQQAYLDFTGQLRQDRLQKAQDRQRRRVAVEEVDIGLVPAQGLVPPRLLLSDLETNQSTVIKPRPPRNHGALGLLSVTGQSGNCQVAERTNAVPTTSQEVADCSRTLSAEDLYQVVISPLTVDFGEVCVQSACVRTLALTNRLPAHVWLKLQVDPPELQRSSPLSHVLPPHSHATLPLVFQSATPGHFHRSVLYTVNQQHPGQVLVQAHVVPPALELSTSHLVLGPASHPMTQSGYRGTVTLRNHGNRAADFTWQPVVSERGVLFSVRPATGTVEASRELDCEVTWHPSFSSPAAGDFDLNVHEGDIQRLHCVAKVGSPSVQLSERLLKLASVPLNMSSIRTLFLHNTGHNPAYFQVLDSCLLPGMVLSPYEGEVPMGGRTPLEIHFNPEAVIKFDTRIKIALRNRKSIEFRVGGSVEPPNIDISVSEFQFRGVHVGSECEIPFKLTNRSPATALVVFDLSEYTDFTLRAPSTGTSLRPGDGVVQLEGRQSVECGLVFSPTQVTGYDFLLPLTVNGVSCVSPPPPPPTPPTLGSSLLTPPTASSYTSRSLSAATSVTSQPMPVVMETGSRRICATALCAPLEVSPSSLEFNVEPLALRSVVYTQIVELRAWSGLKSPAVCWVLDCSAAAMESPGADGEPPLLEVWPRQGSLGPGQSISLAVAVSDQVVRAVGGRVTRLSLPLFLVGENEGEKDEGARPYRELVVTVTAPCPTITILPTRLLLTPVPLDTIATATLTLWATGYPSGCSVSAEVREVDGEEGSRRRPCLSVVFPQGSTLPGPAHNQGQPSTPLTCCVSFSSSEPVSVRSTLVFSDHLGNRFEVEVCAATDSCLLSVWPYVALHRLDQHIVLKNGVPSDAHSGDSHVPVEAILQHCQSPRPASCLTSSSSTSSFAPYGTPNRTSISDSCPDSQAEGGSSASKGPQGEGSWPSGAVPRFPGPGSEEGFYSQGVLLAAQRWFTLFGWPDGPHPVAIPYTLRRVASKIQSGDSRGRCHRVIQSKDSRSVVDMLHHLSSTQLPGVPLSQSLSRDVGPRTNQLLGQHEAMLAFLRERGACLAHIRPEYLLDTHEFNHWCSLQGKESDLDYSRVDYESLSKRSWLDVLLQIYKVLVLCRVSGGGHGFRTQEFTGRQEITGHQALGSNVYSSWELHLLAWLNTHYQAMRSSVWSTGELPAARWIVNFDFNLADGLVLAALLAAYCPHLASSHFHRMYTQTSSLEQILHNNIILVQALCTLSLNIDIQPTDLSDPNPVQMLMLCVHLYEHLPRLRPLSTVTLSGELHSTITKQVCLKSPSSKPLQYQCSLLGSDARFFSLPSGSAVTIPPRASAEVGVHFTCSSLRPMEALLLLTSCSPIGPRGATLAFALKTQVTHLKPTRMVKCTCPCYQLKHIRLPVTNPFPTEACFRVLLTEVRSHAAELDANTISLFQQASVDTSVSPEESDSESRGAEAGEFFSVVKTVCLKPGQVDTLEVHFLPLSPGTKHCSLLLLCPQVGDMVYSVKAVAELPLPCPLTATPTARLAPPPDTAANPKLSLSWLSLPSHTDIASVHPDGGEPVLGLRCVVGEVCEVLLRVPRVNEARERALVLWAQHSMSPHERRRRRLTHTLDSSSVRTAAALRKATKQQTDLMRGVAHSEGLEYSVEVSLPDHFDVPHTVAMPVRDHTVAPPDPTAEWECVSVPVSFQANVAGQFRCQLVLRSWLDTRVYVLEMLVTAQGGHAHLDFSLPAHQSITQDIPLHNETRQAWRLRAKVSGPGFSGPELLDVPAEKKASYPLTFRPTVQCVVTGKLSLVNDSDGTEHTFTLRGTGQRPRPVDHLVLHCQVGQVTHTELRVPNYSRHTLTLQVVTDLSIASGATSLEIKPGHTAAYTLAVSPWKRGQTSGRVSFVSTEEGEEPESDHGDVFRPYEVCFSVEITSEPPPPLDILNVQSCVLVVELTVRNPGGGELEVDVTLEGEGLSGEQRATAPPWGTLDYRVTFAPVREGRTTGSVVFQSECLGELWYQLECVAVSPPPSTLTPTQCQLGRWVRQTIVLENPTAESLELAVANSNPRNFTLEMDRRRTVTVAPHSSSQLGVCFSPSFLGDHRAQITFSCPQITEWCFLLSGCCLQPVSISCVIGSHALVNIPFSNPTEQPALLSISLTDEDPSGVTSGQPITRDKQVFWVPLKRTQGLRIGAGAHFDVPVVFAPESMKLQRAWLYITLQPLLHVPDPTTASQPANKDNAWCPTLAAQPQVLAGAFLFPKTLFALLNIAARSAGNKAVDSAGVRWVYALRGVPTMPPLESAPPGVVRCQVGRRLEEPLEVLLTGSQDTAGQEGGAVCVEDFRCEVCCDGEEQRPPVEESAAVSVAAACRDPMTGVVALTANLVYTPRRPHRCSVFLAVRCVSGALWKFPLTLVATDLREDDIIRLTSTTRSAENFQASFLPGSGSEVAVSPSDGVLPPQGSTAPVLTAASTPTADTETHRALLLQTRAGPIPGPHQVSLAPSTISANRNPSAVSPANRRTQNHVAGNLRLPALANSSPFKVTFQR